MNELEKIRPAIEEKCSELGFELYEARLIRAGSRMVLKVIIDIERGVTISDCELVSNNLSLLLDLENFLGGKPYTLEVSSPGIDWPLKNEKDFRRVKGRNVSVTLKESIEGKIIHKGIVLGCEKSILYLENNEGETIKIPLEIIIKGKQEIKF